MDESDMKQYIVLVIGLCFILFTENTLAQRSEVVDLANTVAELASNASLYARRAYNASSFDELREYARKAKLAAEEGESEAADAAALAEDYGCDDAANYLHDAETYLNDATTYARRAYNAESFEDAEHYARKAKRAADDAEAEAINASNECED
jgi:hypothetical protein